MVEKFSVIPEGKMCEGCGEFRATSKITYGKFLNETTNPKLVQVSFVCEMCLLEYEASLKGSEPYRIEENPEVVQF